MKWIGQHIWDFISRFRSDVYLESLATTTETNVLVVDSAGKVSKSTSVAGDLTSVVAGTGLSGIDLTGPIPTLNVDASQTQITEVGTISVGAWRGTPLSTAYIADDAITEDKLDNTLLAEIDANTAKPDLTVSGAGTVHVDNYIENVVQVNVTGNAATATALTSGDKTINGNLIVTAGTAGDATLTLKADTDNSNEADNPYIAFEQDGAGVTAQIGFSGGNDEHPDASTCTGAITNALIVGATGTGAARKVQIATQSVARVTVLDTGLVGIGTNTPAYELDVTGDLSVSGNILPGIANIKILPRDFTADDGGRPVAIDDVTTGKRHIESHSNYPMYASVEIPMGFKATSVWIYGNGTSAVTVNKADINSATITSVGSGSIGSPITITHTLATTTNYLLIELAQTSGEKVYGGLVAISKN